MANSEARFTQQEEKTKELESKLKQYQQMNTQLMSEVTRLRERDQNFDKTFNLLCLFMNSSQLGYGVNATRELMNHSQFNSNS